MMKKIFFPLLFILTINAQFVDKLFFTRAHLANYENFNLRSLDNIINKDTKLHFNRIEGFVLGQGLSYKLFPSIEAGVFGSINYGFGNKRANYEVGVEKHFINFNKLVSSLSYFDKVTSFDDWKSDDFFENTFSSFLLKRDFKDYFIKKGVNFELNLNIDNSSFIKTRYSNVNYLNMNNENFAKTLPEYLKINMADFRKNSDIKEGRVSEIQITFRKDNLLDDNMFFGELGLDYSISYLTAFGDFNYNGLFAEAQYKTLAFGMDVLSIDTKLVLSNKHDLPQYYASLGGIGSLKAFPDNFMKGENLFYLHFSYSFKDNLLTNLLLQLDDIPVLNKISSIGLFVETGNVWNSNESQNVFQLFSDLQFKSDLGVYLSLFEDKVHIEYAHGLFNYSNYSQFNFRVTIF